MPQSPINILAIHPGALGDIVLFGQFLSSLRGPGGHVRLVAGGEKARLLAGLGVVDEALDFESLPMSRVFEKRGHSTFSRDTDPDIAPRLAEAKKLNVPFSSREHGHAKSSVTMPPDSVAMPPDLLVSCFAAGDAAAERRLAELAGARRTLFLPVRPPAEYGGHLLDLWAERAGVRSAPPPEWSVPLEWRTRGRTALAAAGVHAGQEYVLVHPGAGSRKKCWPLEQFLEVGRALDGKKPATLNGKPRPAGARNTRAPDQSNPGLSAVFVLGPVEREWWGSEIIESVQREFPVLLTPPLAVLAAVAAEARAYLGNDSGPTHLAAAVGAPTVALFVQGSARHFAPRGRQVRILAAAGGLAPASVGELLRGLAESRKKASHKRPSWV